MKNQAISWLIESLSVDLAAGGAEHWRVGITTASVEYQDGPTENIDPGEAGTLLGPVIDENTADPGGAARDQVLCKGTAWDPGELEFDGDHVCGEPAGATMSEQYLECTCGSGGWNTRPGSGNEEPLEAVRTVTCQADPSSLSGCSGEAAIHPGLLAGGNILVLTISDEGDNSRALSMGDGDPGWYQEALTPTQGRLVWSTIGPGYNRETGTLLCNDGGAVTYSIERLQRLSAVTGGTYAAIRDERSPDCALADFQTLFDDWWATAVGSLTAGR